ncbi:MAG: 50S ribosomal protein L31 [Candidatus Pacebacteria bacterium]|nr:50S ribosomal protein L31 [Candidatus Paceibacterota bacterium]
MKADIHPQYYQAAVKCACGNTFTVGSTKEKLDIEVCSSCHPFYIGDDSKKILAGRLEKFKNLQATAAGKREAVKATATKRAAKKSPKKSDSDEK